MKRKKFKIFLVIIGVILIAAVGGTIYGAKRAHKWFQSAAFETYLHDKIREYGNIQLAFGDRDLRFLPRPQVVIRDVDMIIDDVQKISIQNLSLSLDFATLFSDTPVIDSITLEGPALTLVIPALAGDDDKEFVFPDVPALLKAQLLKVQTDVEVDEMRITNGRADISFTDPGLPQIILSNILFSSDMRHNRLDLTLSARGNIFSDINLKSTVNFNNGSITASGQVNNLKAADFIPLGLFVKESVAIETLGISTKFAFKSDETLALDLTALNIDGRLSDGQRHFDAEVANSQLGLELQGQTVKLSSQGLNIVAPRGRMTADMSFDLADLNHPQIVMEFSAFNMNVGQAGYFLGVLDDDAAHLFTNIIQGGVAEELRFYIACDNFDDIFRYRKFELDFVANDATIHIFPIRLLLEKIDGKGQLKDGYITMTEADGFWRDSPVNNANLWLDLNTDKYDFTFHSGVEFNLAHLQELLLLVNPKFSNQLLDRIENLQGRVKADLDVKYKNSQEVITVVTEKFNATGVYKVGKLPLNIQNGLFTYADTKHIEFSAPSLTMGNSKVQTLNYRQDLTPERVKANTAKSDVSAAVADVALNQILPVITEITAEKTPEFLRTWQFTSGSLMLKNFKLNGVIDNADTWLIDADVSAKNVSAFNKNFANEPFTSPTVTTSIKTSGETVTFNDINAQLFFAKDNEVNVKGRAQTHPGEIVLDLDIAAPKIDFDLLLDVLDGPEDAKKSENSDVITGKIDFAAGTATLFERTWSPVKASITMTRDRGYLINLDDVALCNIALKGQININDGQIDMRVEPWLTDGRMEQVLPCLSKDLTYAEGDLSVQGYVTAKGNVDNIKEILNGEFQLYSKQGHIHKMTLLANLLSIVNVTEFYKGSLPNFNEKGFDYSELLLKGKITNGNIVIDSTTIDSSFFTAVASGNIDIANDRLSIDILVAPFKTADRLVSYIPIIGHIMGNNLVALPFRATGSIEDPTVIPIPPDAVGSSLLGILERTITAPISIFDNALFDLFRSDSNAEKNPNKQPGAGPSSNGEINEFNPSGQTTSTPSGGNSTNRSTQGSGSQATPPGNDGFGTTFYGPGPDMDSWR